MLFPSIAFVFYFLPPFFIAYCLAPGIAAKNAVLLLASLLFCPGIVILAPAKRQMFCLGN